MHEQFNFDSNFIGVHFLAFPSLFFILSRDRLRIFLFTFKALYCLDVVSIYSHLTAFNHDMYESLIHALCRHITSYILLSYLLRIFRDEDIYSTFMRRLLIDLLRMWILLHPIYIVNQSLRHVFLCMLFDDAFDVHIWLPVDVSREHSNNINISNNIS